MVSKLIVIGIDSLDPFVLSRYKNELPNFKKLMDNSPTFISKSVFPVDTIPSWASIYTGLNPGNHGLLYTYDVFDSNLGDLAKLDINRVLGKTFWDIAGIAGYKTSIIYPMLIYPCKQKKGIMISKSPFDNRIDWISSEIDIDASPNSIREKYEIPEKLITLWGGFPGINHLDEWAEIGKEFLMNDADLGLRICKNEQWDLFFIYFSLLDIIQHRLWRFFDETDPAYQESKFKKIIIDYYKILDKIIGDFMGAHPDASMMVLSDHGHKSRPIETININWYLRRNNYLEINKGSISLLNLFKKIVLNIASELEIEDLLIRLVVSNKQLITASKLVYSSEYSIDKNRSIAYLSTFAGIKSYPFGGIEINKNLVSINRYEIIREQLISSMSKLKSEDGQCLIKWIMRPEDLYSGNYTSEIYPDLVFELNNNFGVGWEAGSSLRGKAHDHKIASGGHRKEAVLLIRNVDKELRGGTISIIDTAPSILNLLGIKYMESDFDGRSIFK